MSSYVQQAGLFSGRQMTLIAVIGLHALVISALIAIRVVPELTRSEPRIQVVPLTDPPDTAPPEESFSAPSTNQVITVVTPVIPVPVPFDVEAVRALPAQDEGAGLVDAPATGAVGNLPAVTPARASTELKYTIVRPTDDYYPNTSAALEEQGVAIVQVCVDAAGRIAGKPTVQSSSGYKRLDQAAVRWASESLRFTPATLDGAAVAACKGFRVNFNLR